MSLMDETASMFGLVTWVGLSISHLSSYLSNYVTHPLTGLPAGRTKSKLSVPIFIYLSPWYLVTRLGLKLDVP